jgi:hypothetical protein
MVQQRALQIAGWLMVALLSHLHGLAQSDSLPAQPRIHLGYLNGVNVARMASLHNHAAVYRWEALAPRLGMDLGILVHYSLQENLGLRFLPTVSLTEMFYHVVPNPPAGTLIGSPAVKLEASAFALPILLQWKGRNGKHVRPWFQAGIQPSIGIDGKSKPRNTSVQKHAFDLGLVGSFGMQFVGTKVDFSVELRFQQGLRNRVIPPLTVNRNLLPYLMLQVLSLQLCFE